MGKEQRRGLRLIEGADGRNGSTLDFLRLFRFKQTGERGVDTVEIVEGEKANRDYAGIGWRVRIGGGLGGFREEAVNRTARFHVPLNAAKALAGTLQTLADAGDHLSQGGTCLVLAHADRGEHVLHLQCLAAYAYDLGQLADEIAVGTS